MKRVSTFTLVGIIAALAILSAGWYASTRLTARISDTVTTDTPIPLPLSADVTPNSLVAPVADFFARADKKPFGMYITPETSPIKDDQHVGYHTGVDVEFTDTGTEPIPVYAIADGTIVLAQWVKGYGGVIVIRHTINGVPLYALYGHLNVASFGPASETQVTAGQQIAILGADHSQETDGVRKHLHFSISKTDTLDVRGYVQNESELSHWLDPMSLYQ